MKNKARWRSPGMIVFIFFLAGTGYLLLTEHRAHVVQFLPWSILLLCPLMHVFMHRGHGGHGGASDLDANDLAHREHNHQ